MMEIELEKQLISGECEVEDLEQAWNKKYEECLGISPKKASEGVLQDIHWACGNFGYFPSYAIGFLLKFCQDLCPSQHPRASPVPV